MAKVTWLGEDFGNEPGPSFNVWNGIRFPKGEAVEVTDAHMLAKARVHALYKVVESKPKEAVHVEIKEGKEEQEVKVKEEDKKAYDYREAEKGSGYTPTKKRVRKPRAKPAPVPDA